MKTDKIKVGDYIEFSASDCCLEVQGEGKILAIKTRADDGDDEEDYTPEELDEIVAFTIAGIEISHPWGDISYFDITIKSGS